MLNKNEAVNTSSLKIGVILPLTGSGSSIGEEVRNGMELARQKAPNIEIIYEDNQSDTKLAVNAAQKLITQDKVNVLISWTSAASEAVAPVAGENKVVLLYGSTINGPALKYDYAFKNFASIEKDCSALAGLVKGNNVGMLGVIADSTTDCLNAFKTSGLDVVAETYTKGTTDFRTAISKFKNLSPKYLIVRAFPADTEVIIRQIKEIGLPNTTILCPNISLIKCDAKTTMEKYPDVLKGAIGTDFYIDLTNENMKKFSDFYEKSYNQKPVADAIYGYEDILILNQASKSCSKENFSDCLKNNLLTQTFKGVGEDLRFNQNKIIERNSTILKFNDNQFVKLEQ